MVALSNDCESGTTSTGDVTTANSGGTGTNAFDQINHSTTSTYSAVSYAGNAAHGAVSMLVVSNGGIAAQVGWNGALGTVAELWGRVYVRISGTGNNKPLMELRTTGTRGARLTLTAGQAVGMMNAAGTVVGQTTATLSTDTWYRIEFHVKGGASTGIFEVKLFAGDSTTPIEIKTLTGQALGATFDQVLFGVPAGAASGTSYYLDDVQANTTAYPGPVSSGTAAPVNTVAPALSSASATVGTALTCTTGTWTGTPTPTYSYQWQRGSSTITGAIAAGYTPVAADVGSTLRCRVTATNSVSAVSVLTAATSATVAAAGTVTPVSIANTCLGAAGVAVATTDPGQGTSFDAVSTGTGGAVAYDADALRGATSIRVTAGTSGNAYAAWLASGALGATQTEIYARAYVKVPTYSTGGLLSLRSGGSQGVRVSVNASGFLELRDSASGLIGSASTVAPPQAAYFRIELHAIAATGTVELRLYTDKDSTIAAATIGPVAGAAIGASFDAVWFGQIGTTTPGQYATFDDVAVSNTAWPGPSYVRPMARRGGWGVFTRAGYATGGAPVVPPTSSSNRLLFGMLNTCSVAGNDGQVGPPAGASPSWTGAPGGGESLANQAGIINAYFAPAAAMRLRRSFNTGFPSSYSQSSGAGDPGAGYITWMSMKGSATDMAAGALDSTIATLIPSLPAGTKLAFLHEPEDNYENGEFTIAAWVAAQQRFYAAVKAIRTDIEVGPIWQSFKWIPGTASTATPDLWYPGDAYCDYLGIDTYFQNFPPQAAWTQATDNTGLAAWHAWAAGKGKPLVMPELGIVSRFGSTTDFGTTWTYTDTRPDAQLAALLDNVLAWAVAHNYAGVSYWNSRQVAILTTATAGTWNERDDNLTPTKSSARTSPLTVAVWNKYLANNASAKTFFSDIGPGLP